MRIKISKKKFLTRNSSPLFIAEIGSNHNGSLTLAKKLIKKAKEIGADFVKLQSWTSKSIFSKIKYKENFFLNDDYRNRKDTTLEKIVKKYSISESDILKLKKYADDIKIEITSTPFSRKEVDFLVDKINIPFIKIASMDLNNYPFINYIAKKKKPIVLSTGMGSLPEIDKAIKTIESTGNKKIIILHCLSIYPAPYNKINLSRIYTLKKLYPYPIGYSDHSIGSFISVGAVAKGATLIEKHFTLDKKMKGWDHTLSAEPLEFKETINYCKNTYLALGSSRIYRTEPNNRIKEFRRSIVAAKKIAKGEIFTEQMLDYKRPGTGLPPEMIKVILGKRSKKNIEYDDLIKLTDF